ncbi:hypothetical protein [Cohnella sp.]
MNKLIAISIPPPDTRKKDAQFLPDCQLVFHLVFFRANGEIKMD